MSSLSVRRDADELRRPNPTGAGLWAAKLVPRLVNDTPVRSLPWDIASSPRHELTTQIPALSPARVHHGLLALTPLPALPQVWPLLAGRTLGLLLAPTVDLGVISRAQNRRNHQPLNFFGAGVVRIIE